MFTSEFIVFILYVIGIIVAYFQLQRWSDSPVTDDEEYQALFAFSLLSWLVYPIYIIARILNKTGEE